MNEILTQLPRAQDAYIQSVKQMEGIDTSMLLLTIDGAIKKCIEAGALTCVVSSINNISLAEKTAMQLHELGYGATVHASGQAQREDGCIQQLYCLIISWAFMPQNRRDEYTI